MAGPARRSRPLLDEVIFNGRVTRSPRRSGERWSESLGNWLFLLPAVAFFLLWQVRPIIQVAWYSFTDFRFLDPNAPTTLLGLPTTFVGLANFRNALSDELVWRGIARAFIFTSLFVPGMILIPMVVATLVDRVTNPKASMAYRLILLIPAMIRGRSCSCSGSGCTTSTSGRSTISWSTSSGCSHCATSRSGSAMSASCSSHWRSWNGGGAQHHTMFFLAGMATIPRDLTEAARIDGASEFRLWRNIIVPRLLPIILVLVVIRFGSAMAIIDEYLIMGAFNRDRPTYVDGLHVGDGVHHRRLAPGVRGRDRLDRRAGDARRGGRHVPRVRSRD